MSIEEELKAYILTRYKSIREFAIEADLPYTTLDSIFRRGVENSSIVNVIKICKTLKISADELADGRISPIAITQNLYPMRSREIYEYLTRWKMELASMDDLTIDGEPVDYATREAIAQGLDVSYELARRNKNRNKNDNKK